MKDQREVEELANWVGDFEKFEQEIDTDALVRPTVVEAGRWRKNIEVGATPQAAQRAQPTSPWLRFGLLGSAALLLFALIGFNNFNNSPTKSSVPGFTSASKTDQATPPADSEPLLATEILASSDQKLRIEHLPASDSGQYELFELSAKNPQAVMVLVRDYDDNCECSFWHSSHLSEKTGIQRGHIGPDSELLVEIKGESSSKDKPRLLIVLSAASSDLLPWSEEQVQKYISCLDYDDIGHNLGCDNTDHEHLVRRCLPAAPRAPQISIASLNF